MKRSTVPVGAPMVVVVVVVTTVVVVLLLVEGTLVLVVVEGTVVLVVVEARVVLVVVEAAVVLVVDATVVLVVDTRVVLVVLVVCTVVLVVTPVHGSGSHVPGPTSMPPLAAQSPGVCTSHVKAPPTEPGRQHWIGAGMVLVVVEAIVLVVVLVTTVVLVEPFLQSSRHARCSSWQTSCPCLAVSTHWSTHSWWSLPLGQPFRQTCSSVALSLRHSPSSWPHS
jgi:hypothetical protein